MNFVLSVIRITIFLGLCATAASGCKTLDSSSSAKVSLRVKHAIGFQALDQPERNRIYENHALIIYVGNEENMGEVAYSPALQTTGKKTNALSSIRKKKNDVCFKIVKQGGIDLYHSQKKNPMFPLSRYSREPAARS